MSRANYRNKPEAFGAMTKRQGMARDKTAGTEGIAKAAAAKTSRDKRVAAQTAGSDRLKKRLGGVAKSLKENKLNLGEDTLGQDHAQAVEVGRQMQAASRQSSGRAQGIIKNRRV